VGATVGATVGCSVGARVGERVGWSVGAVVGATVVATVGCSVYRLSVRCGQGARLLSSYDELLPRLSETPRYARRVSWAWK
jgi:hypothetical protein